MTQQQNWTTGINYILDTGKKEKKDKRWNWKKKSHERSFKEKKQIRMQVAGLGMFTIKFSKLFRMLKIFH